MSAGLSAVNLSSAGAIRIELKAAQSVPVLAENPPNEVGHVSKDVLDVTSSKLRDSALAVVTEHSEAAAEADSIEGRRRRLSHIRERRGGEGWGAR